MQSRPADPAEQRLRQLTRRQFFGRAATGLGAVSLASLLQPRLLAGAADGGLAAAARLRRLLRGD